MTVKAFLAIWQACEGLPKSKRELFMREILTAWQRIKKTAVRGN